MNSAIAILILIFVVIAFVATIIAGLLKLVFFSGRKDTYRLILKFGLLGEVAGLIVMFAIWLLYRKEINNLEEPESVIAIPFLLMLLGQIVGTIVVFRNRLKT